MSWLLDVNLILASRWTTHPAHLAAKAWIDSVDKFYTTAIAELGFVRISLSGAYRADWDETQETLKKLHGRQGYQFLADDVDGTAPPETGSKDTTDAVFCFQNFSFESVDFSFQLSAFSLEHSAFSL